MPEKSHPKSLDAIRLSVIIPVYNEIGTVAELLDRVVAVDLEKEVIIVDDGSDDGTLDCVKDYIKHIPYIRIIVHEKNLGKGAALRTGFQYVSGDVVIVQDADLEYNPSDYLTLLEPILEGRTKVVYGSRFMLGRQGGLTYSHYLANRLLTAMSNIFTGYRISDMTTCYKVFSAQILRDISLKSNRFGFEPEFTAKISKQGYGIREVPISYTARDYRQGKKIGWLDALDMLWCILRYNLVR
ncbi:Undecaprenyl-phosphate mannosyltransferase [subsurface metagenome]